MLKTLFSQLTDLFARGGVFFVFIVAAFAALSFLAGFLICALSFSRRLREARKDAVKKSRAVLGGLAGEQVSPFLPGFPCNPADARFVGKPVDFVAFPGAADGDEIKEILLIEVKSGEASLSKRERQIKACAEAGRVRFVEYRIPD